MFGGEKRKNVVYCRNDQGCGRVAKKLLKPIEATAKEGT